MGLFLIPILAATIAPSEQFCLANAARTGTPCLMWSGRDLRSACHGGIHAGVWVCFSFLSLPRSSRQANNSASRTQLGRGPRALCGAFLPSLGFVLPPNVPPPPLTQSPPLPICLVDRPWPLQPHYRLLAPCASRGGYCLPCRLCSSRCCCWAGWAGGRSGKRY